MDDAEKNRALRRAAGRILPIFEHVMTPFQARAETRASCRRGCHHCCYTLVGATLAEAVLLADHVQRAPEWRERLPALLARLDEDVAIVRDAEGSRTHAYLAQRRPCVFLDTARGECTVYGKRPLACRAHYVVSAPELCSPGLPQSEVLAVDARQTVRECALAMTEVMDPIPKRAGHLPEMLLEAFELLGPEAHAVEPSGGE